MGYFSGIGETEVYERGVYLSPGGSYELEVQKILLKETRKSGLGFIVEFKVLQSTHEDHAVGSKATWFQKLTDKDVAFPAIKAFFIALLSVNMNDPEEKEEFNNELESLIDEATSSDDEDSHPLKGHKVHCDTHSKLTKKGADFTVHNWSTSSFDEAA